MPAALRRVEESAVPSWLWRSEADSKALAKLPEDARYSGEVSAKQVFDRLAGTWTYWGWKGGYFTSEEDARTYFDEMRYMLAMQMAAPNSPQWFNTGLHWAYGIDGPSQGHFYVDYKTGKLTGQPPPMSIRNRMPVLSSRSAMIWSMMAASWICGSARHACLNTDRALDQISASYAVKGKACRAGASHPV